MDIWIEYLERIDCLLFADLWVFIPIVASRSIDFYPIFFVLVAMIETESKTRITVHSKHGGLTKWLMRTTLALILFSIFQKKRSGFDTSISPTEQIDNRLFVKCNLLLSLTVDLIHTHDTQETLQGSRMKPHQNIIYTCWYIDYRPCLLWNTKNEKNLARNLIFDHGESTIRII